MFVKVTKAKNRQYIQLVRSYRQDGKVKHEVVLNLGRLDDEKNYKKKNSFTKRRICLI
jgi:hypothetical protein